MTNCTHTLDFSEVEVGEYYSAAEVTGTHLMQATESTVEIANSSTVHLPDVHGQIHFLVKNRSHHYMALDKQMVSHYQLNFYFVTSSLHSSPALICLDLSSVTTKLVSFLSRSQDTAFIVMGDPDP